MLYTFQQQQSEKKWGKKHHTHDKNMKKSPKISRVTPSSKHRKTDGIEDDGSSRPNKTDHTKVKSWING